MSTQIKKQISKKRILEQLADVKAEITRALAPHAALVTPRDVHGDAMNGEPDYATSLLAYINMVEMVRKSAEPELQSIANNISSLGGKNWHANDDIVQAWMAFAHVVQTLRHNPAKGPAVVYVSDDNQMISFAAANFWLAEMQPSERYRRKHLTYEKGRQALNICAEPAAIAKVIGHTKLNTRYVLRSKKSIRLKPFADKRELAAKDFIGVDTAPRRRVNFLARISDFGRHSGKFKNSTLITTADPCRSCTEAVVDVGVALVISDIESHHHPMRPKRMAEMQKAEETLHSHGVAHRHITYRHDV